MLFTMNLMEKKEGQKNDVTPFARLATRSNEVNADLQDFLISIRGTMTTAEWGINFSYRQETPDFDSVDKIPMHRGFAALGSAVFSSFQPKLQEAFDNGKLGLITVTGNYYR